MSFGSAKHTSASGGKTTRTISGMSPSGENPASRSGVDYVGVNTTLGFVVQNNNDIREYTVSIDKDSLAKVQQDNFDVGRWCVTDDEDNLVFTGFEYDQPADIWAEEDTTLPLAERAYTPLYANPGDTVYFSVTPGATEYSYLPDDIYVIDAGTGLYDYFFEDLGENDHYYGHQIAGANPVSRVGYDAERDQYYFVIKDSANIGDTGPLTIVFKYGDGILDERVYNINLKLASH